MTALDKLMGLEEMRHAEKRDEGMGAEGTEAITEGVDRRPRLVKMGSQEKSRAKSRGLERAMQSWTEPEKDRLLDNLVLHGVVCLRLYV